MPRKFTKFLKSITASTSTSKLYKSAQSIADDISEFLNSPSNPWEAPGMSVHDFI